MSTRKRIRPEMLQYLSRIEQPKIITADEIAESLDETPERVMGCINNLRREFPSFNVGISRIATGTWRIEPVTVFGGKTTEPTEEANVKVSTVGTDVYLMTKVGTASDGSLIVKDDDTGKVYRLREV